MNTSDTSSEKNIKVQLIIEALKWFGLYGIEKTSMREIADCGFLSLKINP